MTAFELAVPQLERHRDYGVPEIQRPGDPRPVQPDRGDPALIRGHRAEQKRGDDLRAHSAGRSSPSAAQVNQLAARERLPQRALRPGQLVRIHPSHDAVFVSRTPR